MTDEINFLTPFNHDSFIRSVAISIDFSDDPILVKQEFENESNINEIARRYGLTGVIPQVHGYDFGDYADRPVDLMEAYEQLNAGIDAYNSLPDAVKQNFASPSEFVKYLDENQSNPDKISQLFKQPQTEQELPTPQPVATAAPEPQKEAP